MQKSEWEAFLDKSDLIDTEKMTAPGDHPLVFVLLPGTATIGGTRD
jgi:hypothetical protein